MPVWNRIVLLLILLAPVLVGGVLGTEAAGDAPSGQVKVSCPIDRGPVTTNILFRVFPIRIGGQAWDRRSHLVMSGIVSGFNFDETGADGPSLWIDGHNNKGFSGGPVVFQPAQAASREECRWRIAGVISGYVPAPVEIRTMTGRQAAAVAISNAGLLRAIPIRTVRELAMKNSIGFRLDR